MAQMATWRLKSRRMPTKLTEFHTHSTHSDGTLGVAELVGQLASVGVTHWSLTDHDTCAGCPEAATVSSEFRLAFFAGIEISAWAGRSVHVLGYGVDVATMDGYTRKRAALREDRMEAMVSRLGMLGLQVPLEEVTAEAGGGILTRPHLARTMVRLGFCTSVGEAFDHYLGQGRPAYLETEWPSVEEAIEIIHGAKGVAVLAHPGIYGLDERIPSWIETGLDGIEIGHPKHTDAQRDAYRNIANRHGILKTASSDYHGPGPGHSEVGRTRVPTEWVDAFVESIAARQGET